MCARERSSIPGSFTFSQTSLVHAVALPFVYARSQPATCIDTPTSRCLKNHNVPWLALNEVLNTPSPESRYQLIRLRCQQRQYELCACRLDLVSSHPSSLHAKKLLCSLLYVQAPYVLS